MQWSELDWGLTVAIKPRGRCSTPSSLSQRLSLFRLHIDAGFILLCGLPAPFRSGSAVVDRVGLSRMGCVSTVFATAVLRPSLVASVGKRGLCIALPFAIGIAGRSAITRNFARALSRREHIGIDDPPFCDLLSYHRYRTIGRWANCYFAGLSPGMFARPSSIANPDVWHSLIWKKSVLLLPVFTWKTAFARFLQPCRSCVVSASSSRLITRSATRVGPDRRWSCGCVSSCS